MIEKLNFPPYGTQDEWINKINEVIDAVNKLETMAKNTNTVLESLVEENNIHEKQIDELQMKDEELAERINYTLAKATDDKEALKLLDEKYKPVDKFAEQRKALEIAVDALKTVRRYTAINQFAPKSREAHIVAKKALEQITAEQKDK